MAGGGRRSVYGKGVTDIDIFSPGGGFFENNWLLKPAKYSDEERNERLLLVMLEIMQEDKVNDEVDELIIAGFHYCFECGGAGRPAIAQKLVERGFIEMVAAGLKQGTPMEWVTRLSGEHRFLFGPLWAGMKEVVEAAQAAGVDVIQPMMSTGIIGMMFSCLKAYEMLGGNGADTANVYSVSMGVSWTFFILDIARSPVLQSMIRESASTFRFILQDGNEAFWIHDAHLDSTTFLTSVLAVVFGRDEIEEGAEPAFSFSESHVEGLLDCTLELLRCESWGFVFVLTPQPGNALLSMVISDSSKKMLLSHKIFIPCLLEGLLLKSDSPRKQDTEEAMQAIVQHQFLQCFQQLACYQPGCEALRAEPKVQKALMALASEALCHEAKDCARSVLTVLWPELTAASSRHGDPQERGDQKDPHVMMSYSWEQQDIIKRVTAELQRRGYTVSQRSSLFAVCGLSTWMSVFRSAGWTSSRCKEI